MVESTHVELVLKGVQISISKGLRKLINNSGSISSSNHVRSIVLEAFPSTLLKVHRTSCYLRKKCFSDILLT